MVGVEGHNLNEKVERAIHTIRDGIVKTEKMRSEDIVKLITITRNSTYFMGQNIRHS